MTRRLRRGKGTCKGNSGTLKAGNTYLVPTWVCACGKRKRVSDSYQAAATANQQAGEHRSNTRGPQNPSALQPGMSMHALLARCSSSALPRTRLV